MKPLLPRPKKKPLIGKTHDDRAKVDKVDTTNAEIVDLKDDKSDIANGTASQIDDVAQIERDKASEAKTDAVADNTNGEVPQECDSNTNVEQSTEAPQQQQQQQSQQPCSSTDDAGASVQQRTVEQVMDVPDDAEEEAQQRTVEQLSAWQQ